MRRYKWLLAGCAFLFFAFSISAIMICSCYAVEDYSNDSDSGNAPIENSIVGDSDFPSDGAGDDSNSLSDGDSLPEDSATIQLEIEILTSIRDTLAAMGDDDYQYNFELMEALNQLQNSIDALNTKLEPVEPVEGSEDDEKEGISEGDSSSGGIDSGRHSGADVGDSSSDASLSVSDLQEFPQDDDGSGGDQASSSADGSTSLPLVDDDMQGSLQMIDEAMSADSSAISYEQQQDAIIQAMKYIVGILIFFVICICCWGVYKFLDGMF